ncbi:hypothetical protein MKX03_017723 [Papaver bracteatum]|nr:hypothetical protein MKX03_017723 [Papaver bracteatum]
MNAQHLVLSPTRRLWCNGMAVLNILIVVLILLVQSCLTLSSRYQNMMRFNHPKREFIDIINRNGPYVGIVMDFTPEKLALESSDFFIPTVTTFLLTCLVGNPFLSIQLFGTIGIANNSLSFGDVSIPKYVAFTSAWTWKNLGSKNMDSIKEMKIGNYNLTKEGQNLLGEIDLRREEFLSIGLKFQQCENATSCLPRVPKVEYGLRGKTMSNGVLSIVIRGVSDLVGDEGKKISKYLKKLVAGNSLIVTVKFLELIGASRNTLLMK